MKHTAIIAASVITLALAGCGKKEDAPASGAISTEAAGAAPSAAVASPGQAFANTAAASDAFEIATSKLAAEKAASAKIKTFAGHMIKAHTESTAKLMTAASAAAPPLTPDPQLTPAQQQTLDALKAASGAAFDTAFAKAQVDAHQMTLDGLKAYAATGDVASLKAFAAELVPIVTAHLNMAKGL